MEDNSHMFDEEEAKNAKAKWTSMPGQDPSIKASASFQAEINDDTKHSLDDEDNIHITNSNIEQDARGDMTPKFDPYTGKPIRPSSSMGRSALIVGLISLVFFMTYINAAFAVIAIVLGVGALRIGNHKKMAIGGIICAITSLVMLVGSNIYISQNKDIYELASDETMHEILGVDPLDESEDTEDTEDTDDITKSLEKELEENNTSITKDL